MVLYPSTHGVCEEGIDEICKIIHANGVRIKRITIDEYLAMKDKKMAKQCMNSSLEKLWCLADEDDEEESYTFDTHEFPAIQIHDNLSSKSAGTGESLMFAEAIILIDDRLVKLIDITLEQWKQIEEYTEIKRRLEVNGINTDVEYDPTNVKFPKWLASKFNNHKTIDWYTKNALWLYWKRGDDEEILTYDEFSDPEEENLREDTKITKIFRIETDIFVFETPLFTEFKEFNHLIQFDIDVLTRDLPGFKTYEDYKNSWIYEWNNEVPWIDEKPWLEDGIWKEPTDDICHECNPFSFKNGHGKKDDEESSKDAWSNYLPNDEGINDDNDAIQASQEWFDDHEPKNDDDDIRDIDDYLIS
ncbi:hypothetical protein Tco_0879363 [Tanacetum coccineum]